MCDDWKSQETAAFLRQIDAFIIISAERRRSVSEQICPKSHQAKKKKLTCDIMTSTDFSRICHVLLIMRATNHACSVSIVEEHVVLSSLTSSRHRQPSTSHTICKTTVSICACAHMHVEC